VSIQPSTDHGTMAIGKHVTWCLPHQHHITSHCLSNTGKYAHYHLFVLYANEYNVFVGFSTATQANPAQQSKQPIKTKGGQWEPTKANKGQQRPVMANTSAKPTAASAGHKKPYVDRDEPGYVFVIYFILFYYWFTCYIVFIGPTQANKD